MKNELPARPLKNEMAIVNLDNSDGSGTHWVCYSKRGNIVKYFDSFGNLRPPIELTDYLSGGRRDGLTARVSYNYTKYQSINSDICGHLCLLFLFEETTKDDHHRQHYRLPT